MIGMLFRKDPLQSQAETLYAAIADRALSPEFYGGAGAPDTPEGRFDVLTLHMFLAIDRLRADGSRSDRLVRLLQEEFFRNLDSALRELGVGDLSVGKKIRKLAEAFYGRINAYAEAFGAGEGAPQGALARNVLGSPDAERARPLADYARAARDALRSVETADLAPAFANLGAATTKGARREAVG